MQFEWTKNELDAMTTDVEGTPPGSWNVVGPLVARGLSGTEWLTLKAADLFRITKYHQLLILPGNWKLFSNIWETEMKGGFWLVRG